ncbi:acyl carrier protein [Planctomicrobium piriforme]|uniref:Uncharacterized protein n=1 Tax=Planctomicrobium piriforme TaxID=1576369 RepID=A0A1I3K3T4_9PLAN|nr:hypothetical protein [Planctomicrobium piriforme]SFI67143.1 hypothetical protein SAMN05421753_111109 [Planctomicrobium piriforme]
MLVAIVLIGAALPVIVAWLCSHDNAGEPYADQQEGYLRTHPPISDEESLALCDPSIPPHVALTVRDILCDALGVDREIIYPDARLIQDLGAW